MSTYISTAIVKQLLFCPPNRTNKKDVCSAEVEELVLDMNGIVGDRHYGSTMTAGARQTYVPRGTSLPNLRQVSLVGTTELHLIAEKMNVDTINPSDLGANIVLIGGHPLSSFPAGVNGVLLFSSGVLLYCSGENEPCGGPAVAIAKRIGKPKVANRFMAAALHRRGIVAHVGQPGKIRLKDSVQFICPDWCNWPPQ